MILRYLVSCSRYGTGIGIDTKPFLIGGVKKALLEEREATRSRFEELSLQQRNVADELIKSREMFNENKLINSEAIQSHMLAMERLKRIAGEVSSKKHKVEAELMLLENLIHTWENRGEPLGRLFLKNPERVVFR